MNIQQSSDTASNPSPTVLIAAENFLLALVLEQYVKSAGHRVLGIVTDMRQADRILKQHRPDLILLDNGLLEASDTASITTFREIPVILLVEDGDSVSGYWLRYFPQSQEVAMPVDYMEIKMAITRELGPRNVKRQVISQSRQPIAV